MVRLVFGPWNTDVLTASSPVPIPREKGGFLAHLRLGRGSGKAGEVEVVMARKLRRLGVGVRLGGVLLCSGGGSPRCCRRRGSRCTRRRVGVVVPSSSGSSAGVII